MTLPEELKAAGIRPHQIKILTTLFQELEAAGNTRPFHFQACVKTADIGHTTLNKLLDAGIIHDGVATKVGMDDWNDSDRWALPTVVCHKEIFDGLVTALKDLLAVCGPSQTPDIVAAQKAIALAEGK